MKILAVDTALGACSVALLHGDRVLAHHFESMQRGHAEALAPMVQSAMSEARAEFRDLQRLAVTTGPGTFTGQRVGLAFMRGLRVALKLPLIGITSLEAMAAAALEQSAARFAAVLHDAKRDEVYAGLYSPNGTLIEPALLSTNDAVRAIRQELKSEAGALAFAGTAGNAGHEVYAADGAECILSAITAPDALHVARLALSRPHTGLPPAPLYLRPPDARVNSPP
ncbi:MAG: tRNA (adenosine(37)-N6)-threonylcarbamoyltransferase complex dimerization subunit type 1 TsaB [Alphaproteobacteria bacterium]|nr:tRNA (adenosine(37)-N6)-threonylcarbamoyltransferase complex dimerization subunit type 1 TsaB [Alphaproteobacteria bacterium]